MQIRTTYIILMVVVAGVLLSLDRLLVREHTNRQRQMAQDVARDHAQFLREYFRSRAQAMNALRFIIGRTSPEAAPDTFRRAAGTLTGSLESVEAVALLDENLEPVAIWQPVEGDPDPLKALTDRPRLQTLAGRARQSHQTEFSGAVVLGAERRGVAALIAVTPEPPASPRYVAALFRLHAVPPAILRVHPRMLHFVSLEDPFGVILTDDGAPRPSSILRAETLYVGDDAWSLRVHPSPAESAILLFERLTLVAMGVILLTALIIIYHLHAHQHAALAESHARLEEQARGVAESNTRLRRLNRDLDDFSYLVSHDLKEPLRGIEGVSRLLDEECGDRLDETGREYVRTLRASAAQMRRLVDDLLRLSRATRRKYPVEPVSLNELVEDVRRTLHFAIEQSHAILTVAPDLPVLRCDRVRMREVFLNLIANALHYAAPGRPPEIRLDAERVREGWLVSVRDNGLGVPPEEQETIFQLFHRGESGRRREGSGVGLAICKRVVENHGGRIWVKSVPGAGAVFHLLLPEEPPAAPDEERP